MNLDLGVGREASLAVDTVLAGRSEFRGLSDFVEHWVVIDSRINTKIELRVGGEKPNRGILFAQGSE